MDSQAEVLFQQGRALFAGPAQDAERGVALLTHAAIGGHGGACMELKRRLFRDDPQAALGWLRRGAELGDAKCRYELAVRLMTGFGLSVDEVAAVDLFQAAADNGHRGAAEELVGLRRRQASRAQTPQASLRAALAEFGLLPYGDRISAAALSSVRLVGAASDEDLPVGTSKLGGAPDLGDGVDWPARTGGPLSFIAQIDLAAVTVCLPDGGLPSGGLLSFFYDVDAEPEDRAGWQVVFTPQTASLRRCSAPDEAIVFRPVGLTVQAELTLPARRTMEGRGLGIDNSDWSRYVELLEVFADDFQPHGGGESRHRMRGHPDAIQGDMRRRIEATLRGGVDLDAAETPELDEAARRWMLLLQVDSDDDAEMTWGDAGRLFFWIPRDALAAGDFSTVFVQLQSE